MKYGEIYMLGNHRLMCGDATKQADVDKLVDGQKVDLVLTDPPYGMKIQDKDGNIGGGQGRVVNRLREVFTPNVMLHAVMIGDCSTESAHRHYDIVKRLTNRLIIWGGQYFADFLPVNGGWLFWDKNTGNNDFSDGELAWTSIGKRVRKYVQTWNGVCMGGNYKLNARGTQARIHPTQKPVELHMKILEDFTKPGDVILDCFGGSGTTLIACNETGRKCLMMEISPDYCDVIINRYENFMGEKAEKVMT